MRQVDLAIWYRGGNENRRDHREHVDDREKHEAVHVARLFNNVDVTMLDMTPAPTAPPIVRMFAFMPLATPVWAGGTARTIRLDMAENARPSPMPRQALAA